MMFSVLALALVGSVAAVAPLHIGEEIIDGSYLVIFRTTSTLAQRDGHMALVQGKFADDFTAAKTWSFHKFHGYAATLSSEQLDAIRADDSVVDFVEAEQVYRTTKPVQQEKVVLFPNETASVKSSKACQIQVEATWGIVRTSERSLDIDGEYNYNDENLGEGVDAYIIDTGIYRDHVEFGEPTRARFGFSAIVGEEQDYDGNGHGTHVAGTVGSTKYGIAKKATLVAVKVLSASGSGSTAGVIDGVEWTCKDHTEKKNKCVANMSLGGGKSDAMNRAVDELSSCGCATAVASGNEARDACLGSPASSEKVYTVNSMDTEDKNSYFSNYGTCTQIYAPGTGITSTWIGSRFAINTISGTSMASPHVCGIMAKLSEAESSDPVNIYDEITRSATPSMVTEIPGTPGATPNLLAYAACQV